MRVPWKCPACQTEIRHDDDAPNPRQVYRCHVCRLELVLDGLTDKLTLAPFAAPPQRPTTHQKP